MEEELKPGESWLVTVEGQEVAVFNVDGRLFAVGNKCPHRQGPLARGKVESTPEGPAIRCPIHGWLFDLNTGRCLNQPEARIPAYSVTCEDSQLCIQPP